MKGVEMEDLYVNANGEYWFGENQAEEEVESNEQETEERNRSNLYCAFPSYYRM